MIQEGKSFMVKKYGLYGVFCVGGDVHGNYVIVKDVPDTLNILERGTGVTSYREMRDKMRRYKEEASKS